MFTYSTRKQAEEELDRRRSQSKTYTEPLPEDEFNVKQFLEDFYSKDLFDNGQEFKAELKKYADSVGEHYKFLVPSQVSYDAFFSRYYYRCNFQNVMRDVHIEESAKRRLPNRAKSGDMMPEISIPFCNFGGSIGAGSGRSSSMSIIPLGDEARRGGRRQLLAPPSRSNSRCQPSPQRQEPFRLSASSFFSKEKPIDTGTTCRDARNEMAMKLLAEAKGKPLD